MKSSGRHKKTADVKQRQDIEVHVIRRQIQLQVYVNVGTDEISVRQQGSPGPAGHSRRMDYDQTVIGAHIHRLEITIVFRQRIETGKYTARRLQTVTIPDGGQLIPGAGDHFLVFGIDEKHDGVTVIKVEEHLLKGQSPVDGQYDRPEGCSRSVKKEIFQAVFSQSGDAIAFLESGFL